MLYQDYLLLLQRITLLEEKRKILEQEIQLHKQKIKQNPNYKIIYYVGCGICD